MKTSDPDSPVDEVVEEENSFLPGWLIMLACVLFFWSGGYVLLFSGDFRNDIFDEENTTVAKFLSGQGLGGNDIDEVGKTPLELGKAVFTNCELCHQSNGLGTPGLYPPLAGSSYVLGSERRLGMILLHGVAGPIKVDGVYHNGQMPAWGGALSDKKIAAVLTYIRSEWGNKAPEVSPEGIATLRKELAGRSEPWSEMELLKIPNDAPLPGNPTPTPEPSPSASPEPKK